MDFRGTLDGLDFVSRERGRTHYWSVEETGTWSEDCARGRGFADQFLNFQAATGASILPYIVQAMAEKGATGTATATGFLSRIGQAAPAA